MNLYRPYLQKFPDTRFADLLTQRYGAGETRLLTVEQLEDLAWFLEAGLLGAEEGKDDASRSRIKENGKDKAKPAPKPSGPPEGTLERLQAAVKKRSPEWNMTKVKTYSEAAFGKKKSTDLTPGEIQTLISVVEHSGYDIAMQEVTLE